MPILEGEHLLTKIQPYAKAAVAVLGFLLVVAGQLASGSFDVTALYTALVAALTALGVWKVANKPKAP
jgi:hypothetical protein